MKKKLKSFLIYLASGTAVVAVALGAMWFFVTPTVTHESLDVTEPESYEQIFEVFMQARQFLLEAEDFVIAGGVEGAIEDDDFLDADEAAAEAEWAEGADENGAGFDEGGLSDEEIAALDTIEIDESYDDPNFIAEYEALHDDPALQEDNPYFDAEMIDDGDIAFDEEDAFFDDEEFHADEEDSFFDEEFYFDEDELLAGDTDVSLRFSDQTIVQLHSEGARNPARVIAEAASNGEFLFAAVGETVWIIQVHPEGSLEVAGSITVAESAAGDDGVSAINIDTTRERFVELFVVEGRLVTISTARADTPTGAGGAGAGEAADDAGGGGADAAADGATAEATETGDAGGDLDILDMPQLLEDPTYTRVQIFDLSNPAAPSRISSYLITGSYSGARMMGADLYLATDYGVFDYEALSIYAPETFIPYVERGGERTLALPSEIRIAADIENRETVYTQLISINITGDTALSSQVAFLGGSNVLYAGASTAYLVNNAEIQQGRTYTMAAALTQVTMNAGQLNFGQTTTLPGMIEGPEFLNERDGILRVVAPSFTSTEAATDFELNYSTAMQVFVLDADMQTIGSLDGFGEGQDLFPDHFLGDVLYLEAIDGEGSNYLVDFSNPRAPQKTNLAADDYLPEILHPWIALSADPEARAAAALPTGGTEWIGLGTFVDDFADEEILFEDDEAAFDDVTDEHIEEDSDSSIALVMHYLEDGDGAADVAGNIRHNTPIAGHHFSDAFTDTDSLTVSAAARIVGFPADYTYLLYSFDDHTGFTRKVEQPMNDQFSPGAFTRGVIAGGFFLIIHASETIEIWVYSLNDFTLTGELNLAE